MQNAHFLQKSVDGGVDVPVSIIPPLKAKLKTYFEKETIPPKAVSRSTRGPVYFKCVRVDYDKIKERLKIAKREFVGSTTAAFEMPSLRPVDQKIMLLSCEDEESLEGKARLGVEKQFVTLTLLTRKRLLTMFGTCSILYFRTVESKIAKIACTSFTNHI